MNKESVLDLASRRLSSALVDWQHLARGDYGTSPSGAPWGGAREATAETTARSLIAAVPLILNGRERIGDTHLPSFYRRRLVALAEDPMYRPKPGFDQVTVEVAGICACLLMLEHRGRDILGDDAERVLDWVGSFSDAKVMNNNWRLFPIVVNGWVGKRRGDPQAWAKSAAHWAVVDQFHDRDGWYRDGPRGAIDYYSGWSFQWYSLIVALTCTLDASVRRTILGRALAFAESLSSALAAGPLPVFGRSPCYREAASAAFGLIELALPGTLRRGHALLEANLRQWRDAEGFDGVHRDFYSCAASPMWRNKWLWQALLPDDSPWWDSPAPSSASRASSEMA